MPTELLMIKTCRWRVILPTRGYGISKKHEKWWKMSWRLPLARFSKEFCVSVVLLGCQMGRRGWWQRWRNHFSAPARNIKKCHSKVAGAAGVNASTASGSTWNADIRLNMWEWAENWETGNSFVPRGKRTHQLKIWTSIGSLGPSGHSQPDKINAYPCQN